MGGEGSMLGMIIALRNNANMRLKRQHFFKKPSRLDIVGKVAPLQDRKKLTANQLKKIRKQLLFERRKDIFVRLIVLLFSILVIAAIAYLIFWYGDSTYPTRL